MDNQDNPDNVLRAIAAILRQRADHLVMPLSESDTTINRSPSGLLHNTCKTP